MESQPGQSGDGVAPSYDQAVGNPQPQQSDAPEWAGRLGSQMGEVLEALRGSGEPEEQEDDWGYDPDELAQLYRDPEGLGELDGEAGLAGEDDDDFDVNQAAQDFEELVSSQVQQGVNAAIQPFLDQQQADQRAAEADALEQAYPELAEEETAERVLDESWRAAQEIVRQTGGDAATAQRLALSPAFNERVFLAMRARERAEQEVPAGSRPTTVLENPGGAAARAEDDEGAAGDAIVKVSRDRNKVF